MSPENLSLRQFCLDAVDLLSVAGPLFGRVYVEKTLELYRLFKYAPKLNFGLFSSLHGPDFFEVTVRCLDGEEWEEKGEYGRNYREFINFYRKLETESHS